MIFIKEIIGSLHSYNYLLTHMNWNGISEPSRLKVDSLMKAFDTFIIQNHRGLQPQDDRIMQEWRIFKTLIEKSPADTDGHNKHVISLRNTLLKEQINKQGLKKRLHDRMTENKQKINFDKTRMMAISKELRRAVLRNTQDPLDMLGP